MRDTRLVTRLVVENFRGIAACDVELGHPLTFLVGPNGSGKSNLLDALFFVRDALRYSLRVAIEDRAGLSGLIHEPIRGERAFAVRVDFRLPSGSTGHYALQVRDSEADFAVQREQCVVRPIRRGPSWFDRTDRTLAGVHGIVTGLKGQPVVPEVPFAPRLAPDRLYSHVAAVSPDFAEGFEALESMGLYQPDAGRIRLTQREPAPRLFSDAANLSSVLQRLQQRVTARDMIDEFLGTIVPGITGVRVRSTHGLQIMEFEQATAGGPPLDLPAASMSDGTLHALAVLVALFQDWDSAIPDPPLVAIEEPEHALHPGAASVLRDALRVAATQRQVLATSHSPDLLDDRAIVPESIVSVVSAGGETKAGPVNEASRGALRDGLFTVGELLRIDQLAPGNVGDSAATHSELFERLPA